MPHSHNGFFGVQQKLNEQTKSFKTRVWIDYGKEAISKVLSR